MKSFGHGAKERLKSRKQIGKVFQSGRYFHVPPLRVSWIMESGVDAEPLQAGVGASGKNFKKAVDRNRIKRLLREAWRLQKLPLKNALQDQQKKLSVFIIFTGKELPEYHQIYGRVGEVMEKLIKLAYEEVVANT